MYIFIKNKVQRFIKYLLYIFIFSLLQCSITTASDCDVKYSEKSGSLTQSAQYTLEQKETEDSFKANTLTGNWFGIRDKLQNSGINLEFNYKADMFSNVFGGNFRRSAYIDNVDIKLNFDLSKLFSWKEASFFFYILGNNGNSICEFTGCAQGISNIEAPKAWKIYELLLNQDLFDNKLSLSFGLYDLNSEFDVRESSSIFINPSHGIGADIAQTGLNGPSIFPTTSLGLRIKYSFTNEYYFQTVALDGVPGNPGNPAGTHIILNKDDGLFVVSETGFQSEKDFGEAYEKYSIGGWFYTSKFHDISGSGIKKFNSGIYVSAEKFLFAERNDPSQGLAVFFRGGFADKDINKYDFYIGGGAVYTGVFNYLDKLGIAFALANNSNKFNFILSQQGYNSVPGEINLEITYSNQLLPWLTIQPDLQYIINPLYSINNNKSVAAGIRFDLSL